MTKHNFSLSQKDDHICGRFTAMASPCEILVDTLDNKLATKLLQAAFGETKRIEQKYSRYIANNLMFKINNSNGKTVAIDNETFQFLQFANTCFELSEGKFDVSSGILRKAWHFDGSDNIPEKAQIESLLPYIGWQHIKYKHNEITLPSGFELDFGGIGKEYAVNKVAQMMAALLPNNSALINFGGDIQVTKPRTKNPYWQVGIENPKAKETNDAIALVNIAQGGLATSGDANRFLLKDNIRYSHILNPLTGYPITNAPRSVTVASEHCIHAGLMATMSLLQGSFAEQFLDSQALTYWCKR